MSFALFFWVSTSSTFFDERDDGGSLWGWLPPEHGAPLPDPGTHLVYLGKSTVLFCLGSRHISRYRYDQLMRLVGRFFRSSLFWVVLTAGG